MDAPKRMFAKQQRLSRRGFDRLISHAKRRHIVVTDPANGKSELRRRKNVPSDAQAIASTLVDLGIVRPEEPCKPTS